MVELVDTVLIGEHARLEPLSLEHVEPLCRVGLDAELWRFISHPVRDADDMRAYVEDALAARAQGTALPFATIARDSDTVVGSTRFGAIELAHRRVEIGWTWVAPAWQRTAINTEAKLLMLRHAFEVLGCSRVELKTDATNERSRRAIARLGARQEGILRKHMVTDAGRYRDTVYFSILDDEWPGVRADLEGALAKPRPPDASSSYNRDHGPDA